jgi:adenine C2-methylase RlmN of 23S rRNA A2503 and tRNA A37
MGQGEPLDNYNMVVEACRAMMDRKRWNLAHGRITISTVGLISQIRKLTTDLPEVSLALSLHAPNQELRASIVPTATRYPIDQLIDAVDNHMMVYLKKRVGEGYTMEERIKESTRRRAMIEYIMCKYNTRDSVFNS